ncbi:hypothetical protein NV379_16990 [Paenibacillus sp. N1-5-1-14]|uniref:hypothetical protein n=1 Tax=Paenibacillus radicibacter TaxID=2972488 RepID=UPI002158FCF1|nr:hypothetical protein [Paenibacillus radicibacter]MCR8644351.1 hypothetical protein [Paenibacillus radicibacter]
MSKNSMIPMYVSDIIHAQQFCCDKLGFQVSNVLDSRTVCLNHEYMTIVLIETDELDLLMHPQPAQVELGWDTQLDPFSLEEWKNLCSKLSSNCNISG